MANEIRVGLELTGEQKVKRGLEVVEKQAEKTGDAIEDMGGQATIAGKATEASGDRLRDAGDDAGFLNRRVIELTDSYKGLVAEFNRTGDESLLKDIGKERRSLRKFENLAKDLLPKAEVEAAGKDAGTSLIAGAKAGLAAGGPALTGVLVGIAASAAPALAATISGAVLGGVGAGGVIGGIALAAKDPRVEAVAQEVGETLLGELQDAASGFVDPVIQSLQMFGSAGIGDKLAPTFDRLAKHVEPLAEGLMGLIDNALPGLERAAEAAGPSLEVLAQYLPEIGSAISDFFFSISDDPETAADALEIFINTIIDAIKFAGDFIEVLTGVYSIAYDAAEALGFISEEEEILKKVTRDTGGEIKHLVEHTEDAEQAMRDFDDAIKDVFGRTMNVREATLRYEQSIDDLTEELTDGKRTLDEHTQAGRDNWQAINEVTQAIEGQREANVANGMSMDEANAKYGRQLEDLRKTLLSLGYNKTAVNAYIDELKKVPTQALTEIHLKGIKTALADIKELSRAVGAIAGYGIQAAISGPGRRASGGPVSAGRDYIVGEQGPELLRMGASGGHVYNASQTAAMMSGPSGGQTLNVVLTFRGDGPVTQAVAENMRYEVRTTANGSAEEYFGAGG
jgi:prefoldin subunit 5